MEGFKYVARSIRQLQRCVLGSAEGWQHPSAVQRAAQLPSSHKQAFNTPKRGDAGRTACSEARRALINIYYTNSIMAPQPFSAAPHLNP